MTQLTPLKKFMEMVVLLGIENSEESEWEGQCLLRSNGRSKARSGPKRGAVPELSSRGKVQAILVSKWLHVKSFPCPVVTGG